MDIYTDSIQNLPEPDKLLLVQRIWDDLTSSDALQRGCFAFADWYETKAIGLGVDFTHRIETGIEELLVDPERRSNIHYGFRYWPIQRFPHLILYDLTSVEILLFGVMHPSQEPDQWIARR